MRIRPNEFYSSIQAVELTKLKNRQAVVKHIEDGALTSIVVRGKIGAGKRYAIKGEWLMSFNERFKKGIVKRDKYTKLELQKVLQGAVDYCKLHGLKTVEEIVNHISKQ